MKVVIADYYPGADIGAKINAASTALIGSPATICTLGGNYTIATPIVIESGHSLNLMDGIYDNTIDQTAAGGAQAVIYLKDNTVLRGSGTHWGAILKETVNEGAPTGITLCVTDWGSAQGDETGPGSNNILVENIHFVRKATNTQAVTATCGVGNSTNVTVRDCYFRKVSGFCLSAGASPASGYRAEGIRFLDNVMEFAGTQNIAVVNAVNVQVERNYMRAGTAGGRDTSCFIDFEANGPLDRLCNFTIANNLIDARGGFPASPQAAIKVGGGNAKPWKIQPAWEANTAYAEDALIQNVAGFVYACTNPGTSAPSGGPTGTGDSIADGSVVWRYTGQSTAGCYNGIIANNVIVAGDDVGTRFLAAGIGVGAAKNVTVQGNSVRGPFQAGIGLGECDDCIVIGNTLIDCISVYDGPASILVSWSTGCTVTDNLIVDQFGNDHIPGIAEQNVSDTQVSDGNDFHGNKILVNPPVDDGLTIHEPRIILTGVHSREWNNSINGVVMGVPGAATAAELQAGAAPGPRPAGGPPATAQVLGHTAAGDLQTSLYSYDPASTAADNTSTGATVIKPHNVFGPGRWLRAPSNLRLSSAGRDALTLTAADAGVTVYNTDEERLNVWTGNAWVSVGVDFACATAGRPDAASVSPGDQIYDTTLSMPLWSDGTHWRNAAGAIA
jgi:Periplasmic copper-binding protein (NosD)